jgi:hypothetical protein
MSGPKRRRKKLLRLNPQLGIAGQLRAHRYGADYFGAPGGSSSGRLFFDRGGVRVRRSKRGRIAVGSSLFEPEDQNGLMTSS